MMCFSRSRGSWIGSHCVTITHVYFVIIRLYFDSMETSDVGVGINSRISGSCIKMHSGQFPFLPGHISPVLTRTHYDTLSPCGHFQFNSSIDRRLSGLLGGARWLYDSDKCWLWYYRRFNLNRGVLRRSFTPAARRMLTQDGLVMISISHSCKFSSQ